MQDWDPAWDIDAETAAFIARTEAAYPAEPPADVAAERAAYDAMCRAFRAPRPPGLAVEEIDGPVPMRRYRPAAPEGAQVLYLHGGGFVLGGLDSHDDVCAEIAAAAGVTLTAVAYRLAPEHRHPAQLEDAAAAFAAVAPVGPTLLVGDSAGATLAAGLALGPARGAAGLVLIYPALGGDALGLPSYRSRAEAPMLTTAGMAAYARHRGAAPDDPTAHPLLATDLAGLPPCFVLAADVDPLRDDAAAWAGRLRAAGVPVRHAVAAGLPHGFLRARHSVARARAAFDDITATVARLARGGVP
jgi:acetyl esterase